MDSARFGSHPLELPVGPLVHTLLFNECGKHSCVGAAEYVVTYAGATGRATLAGIASILLTGHEFPLG